MRSSAFFWVKNSKQLKTTISFCNYWKFKNATDVSVVLNLRKVDGELVGRKLVDFSDKTVCNFSPPDDFEGSVEVEAFSAKNMRIPYAAVMGIYESPNSVAMVHSYARAYSQHEIEDKRTLSVGEESCWTLRESADVSSFAVFHNGCMGQDAQTATLAVRNGGGAEMRVDIALPALQAFETRIIEPRAHFDNLIEWLDGMPGNARLSFRLNGGFTRMLCGVRKLDDSELQVTHSNFDYSAHDTDKITEGVLRAYMRTPHVHGSFKQEIVVYPDTSKGEYVSRNQQEERSFSTGDIHKLKFTSGEGQLVAFSRKDNILPTRIVTALRLNADKGSIPAECSLGVVHHHRPKKHFSWMVVAEQFGSTLSWVDFEEVYGGCPADAEFVFKLYSENTTEVRTTSLQRSQLPANAMIGVQALFADIADAGRYCYVSVWCSYGGLMFFSTMQKKDAISIEHSF
ncbi:MAG: hypothetical protein V4484_10015 [Pseudomonadota bacterium]